MTKGKIDILMMLAYMTFSWVTPWTWVTDVAVIVALHLAAAFIDD